MSTYQYILYARDFVSGEEDDEPPILDMDCDEAVILDRQKKYGGVVYRYEQSGDTLENAKKIRG